MQQAGVAAGINRAHPPTVWVTSKIEACNDTFVREGHCKEDTENIFVQNLVELNATSVDLMLLHAPTATGSVSHFGICSRLFV